MKFMMLVKATKDSEAGLPPKPELMAAIGKLAEEAIKRGVMVDSGGLFPTSQSTRIHLTGGKTSMIDGPFAETKELVGGYAMAAEVRVGHSVHREVRGTQQSRHFPAVAHGTPNDMYTQ